LGRTSLRLATLVIRCSISLTSVGVIVKLLLEDTVSALLQPRYFSALGSGLALAVTAVPIDGQRFIFCQPRLPSFAFGLRGKRQEPPEAAVQEAVSLGLLLMGGGCNHKAASGPPAARSGAQFIRARLLSPVASGTSQDAVVPDTALTSDAGTSRGYRTAFDPQWPPNSMIATFGG